MNILYFLLFGFLSSLVGNVLGMLSKLVTLILTPLGVLLSKLNESLGIGYMICVFVFGYILTYLSWFIGATTGLKIAEKYSDRSLILFWVFVAIIAFLNFRVWKIFLDQQKKNLQLVERNKTIEMIVQIGDYLIFYAILIPLILFSIKPNLTSPLFDIVYRLIENRLPN